jgi:pyruvate/2-oxoglutarate dehydrogenase complex dihydrolipoamide acyltransferase (E2) component
MPQMGVSVAEGTLAVWHKQVGDWVEADETICEISTDKIDVEVPSPASGRVAELLVAEDETVPVGAPLARIATDAAPGEAHPAEGEAHPAEVAQPAMGEAQPAEAAPSALGEVHPGAAARGAVYSPVVTRIAAEHGIDLATVKGTGRGGRVRKQDVLAALGGDAEPASALGDDAAPARALPGDAEPSIAPRGDAEPPLHIESPYRPDPEQATREPLSRMRRAIGEHMTRSLRTAAHCTTIVEADMTGVERARARDGVSPLPFVARAVIDALREHPTLNATLEGDVLTRHRDVNLGIAVSLGDKGLIVPVIHRAQQLSAEGLAERIGELARRARAGDLTPDEVRGGTFTITNPGSYGSLASTPIINQPQVAILDLETVTKRPVVISDADGSDAIAIRPVAYLCLSWDHRALDGAQATTFLGAVRERIEAT